MKAIRTLAERVNRGRILKRRLPASLGGGRLFVSPDSSLGFLRPRLESDLFDFAAEFVQPGHSVWDLGANVGLFTFAAAFRAGVNGHVLAIEPDEWLVGLLQRSRAAQQSNLALVEILPAAVSDSLGIAEFNIAKRGRSANFLATSEGSTQSGGIRSKVQVLTITLDWLLEHRPAPAVIKIDVEGAELGVLRGGEKLFRQVRPIMLCEVNDNVRGEVSDLIRSYGYTMYNWISRAGGPIQEASFNTLAIPQ